MIKPGREIKKMLANAMGPKSHWFTQGVSVSKLAAVLAGMANRDGGTVLLGVAPRSGRVQGVSDTGALTDNIFQAALLVDPPLVLPMPRIVFIEGKRVMSVTVPPGLPHAFSLEGRYLYRKGSRTEALQSRRLRALLIERGEIQFEAQVPENATIDDLDFEQIKAYRQALGLPSGERMEELLLRRGCLGTLEGQQGPTYAALLLFGRHPQRWVPSATILAARFSGAAISDQFTKQEIRGTLPQQLRQAETFVHDQLRSVVRIVGLQRTETPEYPLEAVRELLVNAVAHRDYNQQGDSIHLHIFADRLEVHSPGGLPGPVTIENLLEARFSRNAVIAQILSDMGFVERLGYGLNRVVTVMRQNHLPEPKFEEAGGAFRVTLSAALTGARASTSQLDLPVYQDLGLNPRQERALGYLSAHKRITNSDYQKLCPEVSAETLRRDLVDLIDKDVLLKMGSKRGTYYILK
ncbi:MAG: ATP-binding protein [Chloroflexota bacterium]|nr:ATP-binding protein [Chloroflexota bacterium]